MWLREQEEIAIGQTDGNEREWNGEYYASYGGNEDRVWEEARQCGFISAGGRPWFSNTLQLLNKGDRVWVNIPGSGYVGVGIVEYLKTTVFHRR